MGRIDIFNGDADGICALTQLRNDEPADSVLVTGVKRDIELVDKARIGSGDRVTVLDVSFDKNRNGLITKDEMPPAMHSIFHQMDVDGNAVVTLKEGRAYMERTFGTAR